MPPQTKCSNCGLVADAGANLEDEGWAGVDGRDLCPMCAALALAGPPMHEEVEAVFPAANPWHEFTPETLREFVFKALRPFALMHRAGCDPGEMALARGVASAMTCITSKEFSEAFDALITLGDLDFIEQVDGDDRYGTGEG